MPAPLSGPFLEFLRGRLGADVVDQLVRDYRREQRTRADQVERERIGEEAFRRRRAEQQAARRARRRAEGKFRGNWPLGGCQ